MNFDLLSPIIFGSLIEPISALFALMILFICFLKLVSSVFVSFFNFALPLRILSIFCCCQFCLA